MIMVLATDCPRSGLEDLELRVGAGELGVFKRNQVRVLFSDHRFELRGIIFAA